MSTQHTPTPWALHALGEHTIHSSASGFTVADYAMPGDGAFIVDACNSHAALVAALNELLLSITSRGAIDTTYPIQWSGSPAQNHRMGEAIAQARVVLAKKAP